MKGNQIVVNNEEVKKSIEFFPYETDLVQTLNHRVVRQVGDGTYCGLNERAVNSIQRKEKEIEEFLTMGSALD